MNFPRREETIKLEGQSVTLAELSAAEFNSVQATEDAEQQMVQLIFLTMKNRPESSDVILTWPNSIVTELTSAVLSINGLDTQGN